MEQHEHKIASFKERGGAPALQGSDTADRSSPAPTPVAPPSSAPPPAPAPENAPQPRSWKKTAALILAPLLLIAAGFYGYQYWTFGRFQITTDDAYIGADIATVSAKVSGYVTAVEVTDNSPVKTGDVIARIDDGDYRLAVQTAKDRITVQQAAIERIGRQIAAQVAAVDQAKAQLASADAEAKRAKLELDRQQNLATRDFGSRQTLETAQSTSARADASVLGGKAAIEAALAQGEVLKAEKAEAEATLAQLRTALAISERDLSFTVIRAPFDGVIGNRAVQKGDYLQPSQRLASLVPLDTVYIDANFKETQLARLRPGQMVDVEIDAMPEHVFHGKVVSFAPASGQIFSLLPPENATGNFTKIVQRLPVRIQVEQRADEHGLLRPGMSVIVRVNTLDGDSSQPPLTVAHGSGTPPAAAPK